MIPFFMWSIQNRQIHRDRRRGEGVTANMYEVSCWGAGNVLGQTGCTTLWMYRQPMNCTLYLKRWKWWILSKKIESNRTEVSSITAALCTKTTSSMLNRKKFSHSALHHHTPPTHPQFKTSCKLKCFQVLLSLEKWKVSKTIRHLHGPNSIYLGLCFKSWGSFARAVCSAHSTGKHHGKPMEH